MDHQKDVMAPKRKAPAIRANPSQTALLRAAYAISHNPSVQAIHELSQQTGLSDKWISSWFSRQRSKTRRASDGSNGGTAPTGVSASKIMTFKTEHQDSLIESEPPSSSPHSATGNTGLANPIPLRTSGRRAPRSRKNRAPKVVVKPEPQDQGIPQSSMAKGVCQDSSPYLLSSVLAPRSTSDLGQESLLQSRLPMPLLSYSQNSSTLQQANSIYSQNSLNYSINPSAPSSADSSSTLASNSSERALPYRQGPIMRSNFRNTMPSDYCSDPVSTKVAPSPNADSGFNSKLPSSASNEAKDLNIGYTQHIANPASGGDVPSIPIGLGFGTAQDSPFVSQQAWRQAFAACMALYHNDPTVYRAMLLKYTNLFPGLLQTLNKTVTTQVAQSLVSEAPSLVPSYSYTHAGVPIPANVGGHRSHEDFEVATAAVKDYSDMKRDALQRQRCPADTRDEKKLNPWNADSDFLDLSGLHYDYAPLSHLQERLEPFRLPESNYLFGRQGMVDCLLDEQLAVEEPFQAAMGLVLLSKLGLEW